MLSRLGNFYRYYPYPYWIDRSRPTVGTAAILEKSILSKAPHWSLPGVTAHKERGQIVLRISSAAREQLIKMLKGTPGLFPPLLTEWDDDADGCIVWDPDSSQFTAIVPEASQGARLAGQFLFVLPSDQEFVRVLEDVFYSVFACVVDFFLFSFGAA